MNKLLTFIASAGLAAAFVACNSDSASNTISYTTSSVVVSSFSLNADDDILEALDSVYFSIDLVNARVFNADSLPYGTDVSRLVVNIGVSGCSAANLTFKKNETTDTVVNYLTNSTDSICFTYGPATLHLVSTDQTTSRDYYIEVNVHKMKPDSLYWNQTARRSLPSNLGVPSRQKSAAWGDRTACLTYGSSRYCLAVTDNPANNDWTYLTPSWGFTPYIDSFNATSEALFILSDSGELYTSTDGETWTSTGESWSHIYGAYGDVLLGTKQQGGAYYHVTYPASTQVAVASGCPVTGTSTLAEFTNKWATSPQVFFIGGTTANGDKSGDMWGYDGSKWAKVSIDGVPEASGRSFIAYPYCVTDSANWTTATYTALIAFGGELADGMVSKEVYLSKDMGIHWKLADDLLQLPDYIPAMTNSQALVVDKTLYANSSNADAWSEMASTPLPRWWQVYQPKGIPGASSRATKPITEWECPYIYLFGGTTASGTLYNTVWRGVINRLSFKPLQ
ncbi:MAG: DUF6242 domain-containing protein [Bacteroidales bacterium]|nr:DUF6242 domain-containing protein [Bacteroidales bacterium]MCD8394410.1 DUF6242 domain-containing protein [Bacteroidales bacterium]